MDTLFYAVPAASVTALAFAFAFYKQMRKEDEGTPAMRHMVMKSKA